jgi:hypothetical protein
MDRIIWMREKTEALHHVGTVHNLTRKHLYISIHIYIKSTVAIHALMQSLDLVAGTA